MFLLSLGERWKKICFFDVNSMYPATFKEKFPCGLGLEWTLKNDKLTKKLMTTQKVSLGSIEWLDFMSNDDRLINKHGVYCPIVSAWGSREVKIGPYKVDGYALVDNLCYIFEYDGCTFHKCDICQQTGFHKDEEKRTHYLEQRSNTIIIRMAECQWQKQKLICEFTPKISPLLLYNSISHSKLLKYLREDKIYGFAVIDIIPSEKTNKFLDINWPPIFKKMDIFYKDLPEWMKKNTCEAEFPRTTIVQSMHAKEILLHTDLIKFYIKHGFYITKLHKFYEYEGRTCFQNVYDVVYKARVEATETNDSMKSTAVKLVSNSMYGQLLMVNIN